MTMGCGRATSRTKPCMVCVAAHERKSPTRRTGRGLVRVVNLCGSLQSQYAVRNLFRLEDRRVVKRCSAPHYITTRPECNWCATKPAERLESNQCGFFSDMNRRSTEVVVSLCLQWDSLPSTRRFYLKHVILGVICAGTAPCANRASPNADADLWRGICHISSTCARLLRSLCSFGSNIGCMSGFGGIEQAQKYSRFAAGFVSGLPALFSFIPLRTEQAGFTGRAI